MKKTILPLAALAFATFALTACGSNNPTSGSVPASDPSSVQPSDSEPEPEKAVRPVRAFSLGEKGKSGTFDLFTTHRINFYAENVYEYIKTSITYGYSMNLGTTSIVTYGTFVAGTTEDGVTSYTLNKAAEVILSSYSNAGGFKLQINTADPNQTYPAEMPAQAQGEKPMAQNKDDVINAYGIGTKIYVGTDSIISFTDPNGEGEEKAEVTTPSGSVEKVVGEFKQVQIVGDIKDNAYSDKDYVVDYLHIYKDNSYLYLNTKISCGYSMILGVTSNVTFGQGEYGEGEDGITPFTLGKAEDVVLNSYSKAGGYSFAINTASESQTYPTELPAQTQGEKPMAQNKDDVINAYGASFKVYTSDANCVMSFNDPNAE